MEKNLSNKMFNFVKGKAVAYLLHAIYFVNNIKISPMRSSAFFKFFFFLLVRLCCSYPFFHKIWSKENSCVINGSDCIMDLKEIFTLA